MLRVQLTSFSIQAELYLGSSSSLSFLSSLPSGFLVTTLPSTRNRFPLDTFHLQPAACTSEPRSEEST